MSWEVEREAIETRFATQWGSTTPVSFDNAPFNPPLNTPWVRLTILNGDSRNLDLANNVQHLGLITIQVFVPKETWTVMARLLADSVATIFSDQDFSGIHTLASRINRIGSRNGWYQINVETPFFRLP